MVHDLQNTRYLHLTSHTTVKDIEDVILSIVERTARDVLSPDHPTILVVDDLADLKVRLFFTVYKDLQDIVP